MIKMLVMDVDGTLTDGKIYMGETGEVMKAFSAHDAVGIRKLKEHHILPVILTGRTSNIVSIRAQEMNVDLVFQGISRKLDKLQELLQKYHISYEEVAYIGDDENDLECMIQCGFCACPYDAMEVIKEQCNYISSHAAGDGAVREIIDYILKNGNLEDRD